MPWTLPEITLGLFEPVSHLGMMDPQLVSRDERRRNEFPGASRRLLETDEGAFVSVGSEVPAHLLRKCASPVLVAKAATAYLALLAVRAPPHEGSG